MTFPHIQHANKDTDIKNENNFGKYTAGRSVTAFINSHTHNTPFLQIKDISIIFPPINDNNKVINEIIIFVIIIDLLLTSSSSIDISC